MRMFSGFRSQCITPSYLRYFSAESNKTVVKALIVVHLYELIQVDAVQVKHETKVISPHEVIY
jgi:hypothetical protein